MCLQAVIEMFKSKQVYIDENKALAASNQLLLTEYEAEQKKYDDLYVQWETLNNLNKPKESTEDDKLEIFWNTKRVATDTYRYKARAIWGQTVNIGIDPRVFYTPVDDIIPTVDGTNDEKSMNALRYVISNVTYTTDTKNFKMDEEWLLAFETLTLRKGDCEDGAILIANIMLKSGVPYWRIRLNAGDVKGGGHCWCTYLRESDNKWVILDWCYWPEESLPGLLYKDAENYYDIWFSWNTKHIYLSENFERDDI